MKLQDSKRAKDSGGEDKEERGWGGSLIIGLKVWRNVKTAGKEKKERSCMSSTFSVHLSVFFIIFLVRIRAKPHGSFVRDLQGL